MAGSKPKVKKFKEVSEIKFVVTQQQFATATQHLRDGKRSMKLGEREMKRIIRDVERGATVEPGAYRIDWLATEVQIFEFDRIVFHDIYAEKGD